MGWENRKGRLYYYRKERIGDKVVSRYVGTGTLAELYDEALLEERLERQHTNQEHEEWLQLETALDQNQKALNQLLQESGLHRPNWGRWRKKRNSTSLSCFAKPKPATPRP